MVMPADVVTEVYKTRATNLNQVTTVAIRIHCNLPKRSFLNYLRTKWIFISQHHVSSFGLP